MEMIDLQEMEKETGDENNEDALNEPESMESDENDEEKAILYIHRLVSFNIQMICKPIPFCFSGKIWHILS